ncbi:MAG: hypothetical protein VR64_05750 [Desulfatitalea sp. BRH_c12]|nr:MAG: hypothetical protein VR64_05750 [Desulfatitalea sp. BRH_c12]
MHIVIDGYNLIRQSSYFGALDQQELQAGRDALVDALAAYKRVKGFAITVVFDAQSAPLGMPRRDRIKGIDVYYSRQGELADAVIKRMADREKDRMTVVSSDNEVIRYAAAKGAGIISADEFEKRILMARMMDIKGGDESEASMGWQPSTRKTGPSRRLSKRQRKMKQKIAKL